MIATDPGLCTMSLSTRTASSLLIFSKFMSFTYKGEECLKVKQSQAVCILLAAV